MFFPASLLSGPSLCIISVFLHFVFNPIHKHVHSYRHHAILVLIPMPYLIAHCATSCRFLFLSLFFPSSAVGHCSVDFGQKCFCFSLTPLPVSFYIERSYPSPMLAFPRFSHCTLRSCGTPTCSP